MGHRYSQATVSRITEVVQERVQAFRKRLLKPRYAVIYLDALFVKVLRPEVGIRKEAVYVALGVTQEGRHEVLGFYLFLEESARVWGSEVLRDRRERRGVRGLGFRYGRSSRDGGGHSPSFSRGGLADVGVHKVRNTLANVRKGDAAGGSASDLHR